jgi:hypothetical protein
MIFPNILTKFQLKISENFELRNVVRDNWGSIKEVGENKIRVVFLLGLPKNDTSTHDHPTRVSFKLKTAQKTECQEAFSFYITFRTLYYNWL